MTITKSSEYVSPWTLSNHLSKYLDLIIPSPSPETNVLFLNSPNFDFIAEVLKLGVKVDVVEQDKEIGEKLIAFFQEGPNALAASKGEVSTYYSADKRLSLHNLHFRSYHTGDVKFDAVFDIGLLPTLPDIREARRAFGEKLISICAENAKMVFFVVENMKGITNGNIRELSVIEINFAYGRNFFVKKDIEVENPVGYTETLYTANKTARGGEFYDAKYSKGYSPWHMDSVNYNLLKHYPNIQPAGEPLRKILVPMAGKTVDIKWLADKGHEVVAVEISQSACREVFQRDDIPFEELDCPAVKGKLFRSLDGKIKMYCCDIFNFTAEIEGQFKSVWERGAVIAFEEDLRKKYFEHVKTLVTVGCAWMSSIFQYDRNVSSIFIIKKKHLKQLYLSPLKIYMYRFFITKI